MSTIQPTTYVEPIDEEEREVLAWCNLLRTYRKLPPINGFVPGDPYEADNCTIANTIEAEVHEHVCFFDEKEAPLPDYVADFVRKFDEQDARPELYSEFNW